MSGPIIAGHGQTKLAVKPEIARHSLDAAGFVLIEDVGGQRHAIDLLQRLGRLMPQYKGALEHEVTYQEGFDDFSYSQSVNTILAHTEAPGWSPSPRYLALYCHRQAQCGRGHTDLLDGRRLPDLLTGAELILMTDYKILFPGPDFRTDGSDYVQNPMLALENGRTVLRFSYNLLTSGEYDPSLSRDMEPDLLPLGVDGVALADRVNELFQKHRTSLLIPDDGLLIWDNQRMLHARSEYSDKQRHLTRYWIADN